MNRLTVIWAYGHALDWSNIQQIFLQHFVHYGFQGGWYFPTPPMMTANWRASASERWTISVGSSVGKVSNIGKQRCERNSRDSISRKNPLAVRISH